VSTACCRRKVVPAANALVELPVSMMMHRSLQLVGLKYDATDNPFTIETQAIPFALAPGLLDEDLVHLTTREYFAANKCRWPGPASTSMRQHRRAKRRSIGHRTWSGRAASASTDVADRRARSPSRGPTTCGGHIEFYLDNTEPAP